MPLSPRPWLAAHARRPLRRVRNDWIALVRRQVRASELWFVAVAIAVGSGAGLLTLVQEQLAHALQQLLYGLAPGERLSALAALPLRRLLWLPVGGILLAALTWAVRARRRVLVDAVEANALHGGRMTLADSAIVSGQTILSNGVGASVGLEAAYVQLGGLIASLAGRGLNLRRAERRILVGAGAGAAIAAAFGAPLAGAFYAFEIVIGAYTPSAIAPVVAAALAGAQVAQRLGAVPYIVRVPVGPTIHVFGYVVYAGLGLVCALLGIGLMQLATRLEAGTRQVLPGWARPGLGGLLLVPLALISPQILSAGHGALYQDLGTGRPLDFLVTVVALKIVAVAISLGFGFRGGLFFASLFLGTLVGQLYAGAAAWMAGTSILNAGNAAMVGMAGLAVAVVGGPFTMAMLVLEATGNFSLTTAVLAAALVSSTVVRETFGYSFSTWRLHLRGETIKSARDVGWMKMLTAGRMMRADAATAPASTTVAEFRRRFPLGALTRVVLVDGDGRYAGLVTPAAAFTATDLQAPVADLAVAADVVLAPEMDVTEITRLFDDYTVDDLAVVDADGRVLGTLSDKYVRKRYAVELEKAQRELFRED